MLGPNTDRQRYSSWQQNTSMIFAFLHSQLIKSHRFASQETQFLASGFVSQHNIFRDLWFKKQLITLKSWAICRRYLGEFQWVCLEKDIWTSASELYVWHVLWWLHKDTVNFFALLETLLLTLWLLLFMHRMKNGLAWLSVSMRLCSDCWNCAVTVRGCFLAFPSCWLLQP